jgi:hypothetical protein|tara:strand:+ start:492 stop:857 length:366 start_codon:yes stop_codon:yes gene_type:complete
MAKKFEENSTYEYLDKNKDGVVSDAELEMDRRILELQDLRSDIENDDKRQDAQRNMAWFALAGMLLYPFGIVITDWIGLATAPKILSDIAPTYFVSVAAIVAAFYGKVALEKSIKNGNGKK